MSAAGSVAELRVTTAVLDGRPSTIITIDGIDILQLQRPAFSAAGRPYGGGRSVFLPADPVAVLPPDSAALLPTASPRPAMIGICDCGDAGCNSLWLRVRRDGGTVVWEPDPDSPRATIDTTFTFELRQYLDELDDAQRSTAQWEDRPLLLARELRRRRDTLFGFLMIDQNTRTSIRLLDATAWPANDHLLLTVATATGIRQLEIPVRADHTDEQILGSLTLVDPDRFPLEG